HLRRRRCRVEVFKPVATGCPRRRGGRASVEADLLAAAAESRLSLAEIAPVRLGGHAPVNVAARRAGRTIDPEALLAAYRHAAAGAEVIVVEATGGLLSPLTDAFWTVHFARAIALPLVLVVEADAHALNRALLTLHAALSAGLRVAGVVVNRYLPAPPGPGVETAGEGFDDAAEAVVETAAEQIAARGSVKVLGVVPVDRGNSVAAARIGRDTQFVIDQVDWRELSRSG
ncbi:MAG: ATP-dependent dethiobiotin synthetase BioD, partial [Planctomycetota bacterium]